MRKKLRVLMRKWYFCGDHCEVCHASSVVELELPEGIYPGGESPAMPEVIGGEWLDEPDKESGE